MAPKTEGVLAAPRIENRASRQAQELRPKRPRSCTGTAGTGQGTEPPRLMEGSPQKARTRRKTKFQVKFKILKQVFEERKTTVRSFRTKD